MPRFVVIQWALKAIYSAFQAISTKNTAPRKIHPLPDIILLPKLFAKKKPSRVETVLAFPLIAIKYV